jgi:hypothetical protein
LIAVERARILPTRRSTAVGVHMQFLDVAAVAVLLGAAPQGENRIREAMVLDDTAAKLRAELVAIHDKWYRAFDVGDGATMDALEVIWSSSCRTAASGPSPDHGPGSNRSATCSRSEASATSRFASSATPRYLRAC